VKWVGIINDDRPQPLSTLAVAGWTALDIEGNNHPGIGYPPCVRGLTRGSAATIDPGQDLRLEGLAASSEGICSTGSLAVADSLRRR